MTAEQAIERSVSHTEIVHLEYDLAAYEMLLAVCEDNTDSNTEHEFWGTTSGGVEWRVHMRGSWTREV